MDLGLNGRVAVIGGGSKGLGRACADSLAQEGANLVICSRNAEELEQAAAEIRAATGAEVLAVPADLSRLEDIQRLIQSAVDRYGRLDIAVANSGGPPSGRATDTSEETWSRSMDMALSFFIRMGREASPHMRQQKWGRIVNILASTVYQPIDNLVTSGVTRMGAVAYAKSLADEVGPRQRAGQQRRSRIPDDRADEPHLRDSLRGDRAGPGIGLGSGSLSHSGGQIRPAGRVGRLRNLPLLRQEHLRYRHNHPG